MVENGEWKIKTSAYVQYEVHKLSIRSSNTYTHTITPWVVVVV